MPPRQRQRCGGHSAEHSAWTGFFDTASQSNIQSNHFPTQCGGNGIGDVAVKVGDQIDLANGQMVPVLKSVDCMVNRLNLRRFIIPIVPCSTNFGSHPEKVVGFATVDIDRVVTNGTSAGIYLRGIFSAKTPGPAGGGNFGTGSVALVN